MKQLNAMDIYFNIFHGESKLKEGKNSVSILSAHIIDIVPLPKEVLQFYVRCRIFFRIRILNRDRKANSKRKLDNKMSKLNK